ncbi:MAG TPA: hypothetical protein EYG86_01220 [Crocinitomicaceae bacterium]|nr:hypothetical protein [Crocinitomicaceae bacterium]
MNRSLLTIFICTITLLSFSQGTEVEYNFQTEEYTFYKIIKKKDTTYRKEIKRPYSFNGIPTKVTVKDLNTFYYDVKMTSESHKVIPVNGDQSVEMLAQNFTSGASAFKDLIGEVKDNDIYKSLFVDGEFQGIEGLKSGLGFGEMQFKAEMERLELQGKQLESTQSKIKKQSVQLKKTFDQLLLAEFVNDQMNKTKLNRSISPSEMKERSEDLIRKIMRDGASLEAVIDKSESINIELSKGYSGYKNAFNLYEVQHEGLLNSIQSLKEKLGGDDFMPIVKSLETELGSDFSDIKQNYEVLGLLVEEYNSSAVREHYLKAFENYDAIQHADFNYNYSLNTDEDITTLKMEFVEGDTSDSSSQKVIRTREIILPTKGGLRINSSAGVSFLRFFEGHDSYNSDAGTVNRISGDAFRPALTTMFHFYRQTYRPVVVGGSFGVSVPIEGDKEFIYMLGSSFIFGKGQRVILNIGAFGGKIERLSGVNVGDPIATGSIVPTKRIFDFGAYVGITLNINKLF